MQASRSSVLGDGADEYTRQPPSRDEQASAPIDAKLDVSTHADSISLAFRLVHCGCDGGHLAGAPFLPKGSEDSKRKYVNRGATRTAISLCETTRDNRQERSYENGTVRFLHRQAIQTRTSAETKRISNKGKKYTMPFFFSRNFVVSLVHAMYCSVINGVQSGLGRCLRLENVDSYDVICWLRRLSFFFFLFPLPSFRPRCLRLAWRTNSNLSQSLF